ncbi:MAG: hypothetical protein R2705_10950 [Ilumatobacteraceae bacterium]
MELSEAAVDESPSLPQPAATRPMAAISVIAVRVMRVVVMVRFPFGRGVW